MLPITKENMKFADLSYEELNEIIETLLTIDPNNLAHEAIRGNRVFAELNKMYIQVSRKLMKLNDQKNSIEQFRYKHYAGKLTHDHYKKEPVDVAILKTDIPSYMNTDKVVIEIRALAREAEMCVKLLEDAKASLKYRGVDIKNSIDFTKFMNGS